MKAGLCYNSLGECHTDGRYSLHLRRVWIELLIAVLALGLTCYAVGYAHGKDSVDKRK